MRVRSQGTGTFDRRHYTKSARSPLPRILNTVGDIGVPALVSSKLADLTATEIAAERFLQEHLSIMAQPLARSPEASGIGYLNRVVAAVSCVSYPFAGPSPLTACGPFGTEVDY